MVGKTSVCIWRFSFTNSTKNRPPRPPPARPAVSPNLPVRSRSAELRFGRSRLSPRPAWLPPPLSTQTAVCSLTALPALLLPHDSVASRSDKPEAHAGSGAHGKPRGPGRRTGRCVTESALLRGRLPVSARRGARAHVQGPQLSCRVTPPGAEGSHSEAGWIVLDLVFRKRNYRHEADAFQHHFPTGRVCVSSSEPTRHHTPNTRAPEPRAVAREPQD